MASKRRITAANALYFVAYGGALYLLVRIAQGLIAHLSGGIPWNQ